MPPNYRIVREKGMPIETAWGKRVVQAQAAGLARHELRNARSPLVPKRLPLNYSGIECRRDVPQIGQHDGSGLLPQD